jgi:hypothetical protein
MIFKYDVFDEKILILIFSRKKRVPVFPGKKSGNPGKTRKNVLNWSKATMHTQESLNICREHTFEPKTGFNGLNLL